MKKLIALLCALTLVLTGCGAQSSGGTSPSAPLQGNGSASGSGANSSLPAAADLNRKERSNLSMTVEGTVETMPATLYVGQSRYADVYSLYIPDEGWIAEEPGEWEAAANDDVELKVKFYAAEPEEVRTAVLAEHSDYRFTDMDENNGFYGEDKEGDEVLEVWLHAADKGTFAVMAQYPQEAAEGFGVRLRTMAESFRLKG
jgi:hypothetical protein